jgi:hypothetical protein
VIHGAHGDAACRVVPRRGYWGLPRSSLTVLSPSTDERNPWTDESRNVYEMVWRPQETLRLRAALECAPVHVHDIGPTGLSGTFTVAAPAAFNPNEITCDRDQEVCEDDIVGHSEALTLPARAFSLQTAQLPNNLTGYTAGDIFIYAPAGRVEHVPLSQLDTSLFDIRTGDLHATPSAVRDTSNEWSLTISQIDLRHWTDAPGTPKGGRVVTVTGQLAIDSNALNTRFAADPSGIGSERSRLARLMSCDRVQLVTHFRTLRALNARDTVASCSTLVDQDAASVAWVFVVSRYEIPVGVTYEVDRQPHTAFFAAQSLTTFDPR